jgi:dCMP deaminase
MSYRRLGHCPTMRPNLDVWGLKLAKLVAERGTCYRRQVGCVLLSARGHILASGYNGVPAGWHHCSEDPSGCPGALAPSGLMLDGCQAIHAEQNALLQCKDIYGIAACYCTVSPCITCVKLLLNTSCQRIVFREHYPHATAQSLWETGSRTWVHLGET